MFKEQQLIAPARHDFINSICEFAVRAAKENGLEGDHLFHVELAVDEACTNIVEHAYKEEKRGQIFITCGIDVIDEERYFIIRLRDNGRPFDPNDLAPSCEYHGQPQVGGLGVHFMRKLMDRIQFLFFEGWNDLYMYKKIGPDKA